MHSYTSKTECLGHSKSDWVGTYQPTRTMVQVVVLSANGESRTLKTGALVAGEAVSGAAIAKAVRKTKPAELVGTYSWKGKKLTLWGWKEGKAGTENKHELPPPHDELLLFGDAVVVSSGGDLTVENWQEFYDMAFGGFEDLGSEDSEEEEEDEESVDESAEEEVEVEETEEEPDGDEEDSASESSAEEAEAEAEEEEEEGDDDDCCDDDGDGGGGAKRRAPRRRTVADPEYRRMDIGLRSRVKLPVQPTKRAPRWQTAAELEPEPYDI